MTLRVAIAFLLSAIIGYQIAKFLLRGQPSLLLRLSIGLGLGTAISSSLFFLLTLVLEGPRLLAADVLASAALIVALAFMERRFRRVETITAAKPAFWHGWQLAALAILIASSATILVTLTYLQPHGGGWDAWAMYAMHAKFMLTGRAWPHRLAALGYWSHPVYPPLVPAAEARLWLYAWGPSTVAPALIAIAFTLATAGVLIGVLQSIGRPPAVAAALLLGTPFFLRLGASEYADVPLAFFYLCTMAAFCLLDTASPQAIDANTNSQFALALFAGATAGYAAWLKNEGLLWIVVVVIARSIALRRDRARWISEGRGFAAGAILPLALLLLYRRLVPATDPLLAQSIPAFAAKFMQGSRWALLGGAIIKYLPRTLPTAGLLLLYFGALRFLDKKPLTARAPQTPRAMTTGWVSLVLTFAGYLAVFLVTPFDLHWHLETAFNRLLVHLWPATLLCSFVASQRSLTES